MKTCYLVTLHKNKGEDQEEYGNEWRLVFRKPVTYHELIRRLPNEARKLLKTDKEAVGLDFSLAEEFSSPLFKNNPTGKECYKDGFDHKKNHIGRLTVWRVKFVGN